MVILTDDQRNPMSVPTKENVIRAMKWLVKDAQPNDSLFFHFSGMFTLALIYYVLCMVGGGWLTDGCRTWWQNP